MQYGMLLLSLWLSSSSDVVGWVLSRIKLAIDRLSFHKLQNCSEADSGGGRMVSNGTENEVALAFASEVDVVVGVEDDCENP